MKTYMTIVILAFMLVMSTLWGLSERAEKTRVKSNLDAEILSRDSERQYTRKELLRYDSTVRTLTDKLAIKPKQVERLVYVTQASRDTGTTRMIAHGASAVKVYADSSHFTINRPCYNLDILLYRGAAFATLDYNDKLSVILYRERPNNFWFIRYGKWKHKAAIYSECGDTIYPANNNIKVIDN